VKTESCINGAVG